MDIQTKIETLRSDYESKMKEKDELIRGLNDQIEDTRRLNQEKVDFIKSLELKLEEAREETDKVLKEFIGKHDFTSFRSSECQSKKTIRIMHDATYQKKENFILDII